MGGFIHHTVDSQAIGQLEFRHGEHGVIVKHAVRGALEVTQRLQAQLERAHVLAFHAQLQGAEDLVIGAQRVRREQHLAGRRTNHAVSAQAVLGLEGLDRRAHGRREGAVQRAGVIIQLLEALLGVLHVVTGHAQAQRAGGDAVLRAVVLVLHGRRGHDRPAGTAQQVAVFVKVGFQLFQGLLTGLAVHTQLLAALEIPHGRVGAGAKAAVHLADLVAQCQQRPLERPHAVALVAVLDGGVHAAEQALANGGLLRAAGIASVAGVSALIAGAAVNVDAGHGFQPAKGHRASHAIHRQAVGLLEIAHRRLGAAAVHAIQRFLIKSQLRQRLLQCFDLIAPLIIPQRQRLRTAQQQRHRQRQNRSATDVFHHMDHPPGMHPPHWREFISIHYNTLSSFCKRSLTSCYN